MTKKTIAFKSRTQPEKRYKVVRDKKGKLQCNCFGFIFHGHCWHTQKARAWAK